MSERGTKLLGSFLPTERLRSTILVKHIPQIKNEVTLASTTAAIFSTCSVLNIQLLEKYNISLLF